jgi:hypothetical protein
MPEIRKVQRAAPAALAKLENKFLIVVNTKILDSKAS